MNEDILFAREDLEETTQPVGEPDSQEYLIFVIDDLKLGANANYVVEIITNNTITYLPMMPPFIRGIINLRGQIIPIVDIRLRLGKPSLDENLVMVLDIQGTQLGILVDAMDQMLSIPNSSILPMPANSNQQLVSGMCTLPDGSGTMLVLDCEQLLAHE